MPRCEALSSLQKTPHYRGVDEIAARLNVKLWDLVVVVVTGGILPSFLAQPFIYTEIKSRRGAGGFESLSNLESTSRESS
jgi:hypothetical protein